MDIDIDIHIYYINVYIYVLIYIYIYIYILYIPIRTASLFQEQASIQYFSSCLILVRSLERRPNVWEKGIYL